MEATDKQKIRETVELLRQHGIQTEAIFEPIGCEFHPSPQDVILMIEDRDQFFANECGLTKADYREWKQFIVDGCPCTATKRDGKPCRNPVRNYVELSPQKYVDRRDAGDLLCGVHIKKQH